MKTLLLAFFNLFVISVTAQTSSNSTHLDRMIETGMQDWEIPGLVAIVVKDGEVVHNKAYGVKDIETGEAVDSNTLFSMASTTKAIVAMGLGILVDEGKIKWNDKVLDHLPNFKLSDPYITVDARIIDLLTHNLGIGNADLLWTVNRGTTPDLLNRFQFSEQAYPLRGGFVYQNIMYAVAGEVIEAVSGTPWTTFVEENILEKLGMTRTQTISENIQQAGNYTSPHYNDLDEGIVKVDFTFSDEIGAAGMMWSSATDISKYLKFLGSDGIYEGDTILKPETFKFLFEPQVVIKNEMYPTDRLVQPNWTTYGLGWFQEDYRGKKLDFHTGSLNGLIAIAGVVHDSDFAVYVFANLDHAELRHAIMYKAIDLFVFDDDSRDWHKEVFELYSGMTEERVKALKKLEEDRVPNTSPSLDLKEYTGVYRHENLGEITVTQEEDKLKLDMNNFAFFDLHHWHYDTFISDKNSRRRNKFLVDFDLAQTGKIKQLNVFGNSFRRVEQD